MQQLNQRAILLGAALITGIAFCCYLLIVQSYILLVLAVITTLIIAGFLHRQLQRLKMAGLITENAVLCIPAGTVLSSEDDANFPGSNQAVTVIVSIFGILAGNKVYKYNCDGIRLLAITIDNEYICFTYGTQKKQSDLKLLHGLSRQDDIEAVAEKFRYETGIIPVVT